jgi:hypothetical protein
MEVLERWDSDESDAEFEKRVFSSFPDSADETHRAR